ncbi:uncharacterized protein LOC105703465 [Orussus abietinus]|uniref:uncharacterized protein LOC105703465 n=1 Tax=Orussus abietinus TaxID=222816 RepID=UPI0006261C9F|nr:uncharacterized protein LOC105703465 [Orussus abietinus]
MLSVKHIKIHGMKDDRWTIKDKLHQYRSVLKLHARDKNLEAINATNLKRKLSRDLKSLTTDVKTYRGIITDVLAGDKRRLHTVLQDHRDLQMAYQDYKPADVCTAVDKDNDKRRKLIDKMYYKKKQKIKIFFELKLESALLMDKQEQQRECEPDYEQQRLVTLYQQSVAKETAAKAIRGTYFSMLTILKKDSIFFDAVLSQLRTDQKDQCKVILRTTIMGQLAAENLDDTRDKYKRMKQDVLINMRERERTLKTVRGQVDDLWAHAQSLVRIESDANFGEKKLSTPTDEKALENQIRHVEEIFDKIKDSMLVRSYEELLPRLEEQMRQKARLTEQYNYKLRERDSYLNKKNHALLKLATLEHSMVSTTGQYKMEKKTMLQEIEEQKKRERELKDLRKVRGELLMKIRAALQNMATMLVFVKVDPKLGKNVPKDSGRKQDKKRAKEEDKEKEENEKVEKMEGEGPQLEKMETDGLALLSQVTKKVSVLFNMAGFELDEEREARARDLYQSYISDYRSKLMFGNGEPEQIGIFVEHEVIDSVVLTRADIKLQSRQIVEANLKPE